MCIVYIQLLRTNKVANLFWKIYQNICAREIKTFKIFQKPNGRRKRHDFLKRDIHLFQANKLVNLLWKISQLHYVIETKTFQILFKRPMEGGSNVVFE